MLGLSVIWWNDARESDAAPLHRLVLLPPLLIAIPVWHRVFRTVTASVLPMQPITSAPIPTWPRQPFQQVVRDCWRHTVSMKAQERPPQMPQGMELTAPCKEPLGQQPGNTAMHSRS